MMSKLIALLALAAVAAANKRDPSKKAPKKNRIVSPLVMARHDDTWCHSHHMGAGQGACIKHPGCCYSRLVDQQFKKLSAKNRMAPTPAATDALSKYGPCHSCDHHLHGWCKYYGSVSTSHCIKLSMCTWKVATEEGKKGECESKVLATDFPEDIGTQCNKNMGNLATKKFGGQDYAADKDYQTWVKCIDDSLKSADGKKCFDADGATAAPIKASRWFPKNDACDTYADCGRKTNRMSDDRCPDGFKFKWEMPSNRDIVMRDGTKRKNNKLGTSPDGCRELYSYKAKCVMNQGKPTDKYKAMQVDEDRKGFDGYFCVDPNGHEIPDTRKKRPLELFDINCNVQRQKHEGMQCPNAVTLTTRGGGIVVNKRQGKKRDCAVHCNSDTDCKGNRWCCFNGCGYKCKEPVKPLAGCEQPPGAANIAAKKWALKTKAGGAHQGKGRHGIQIVAKCGPGYAQVPTKKTGPQPIQSLTLKCQHGAWHFCPPGRPCIKEAKFIKLLECKADCDPFILATETFTKKVNGVVTTFEMKRTVTPARSGKDLYQQAKAMRARDILETARSGFVAYPGDPARNRHHGATRTIACPPGYGAVQHEAFLGKGKRKQLKSAKSLHIVRHGYEKLTCGIAEAGKWEMRHLECSVCYDAYEWQWRDKKGNSCAFYRSRPLKCHDLAEQTVKAYTEYSRPGEQVECGKYSAEWAQVGLKLLRMNQIGFKTFRKNYQPWGSITDLFNEFKDDEGLKKILKADANFGKKPQRTSGGGTSEKGATRYCACIPDVQPGYYKGASTSPPSVCGQMIAGKKVYINPVTGKKFKSSPKKDAHPREKFDQKYYTKPKISYGSAVDACRVACRSCEQAEGKFLMRTRYTPEVFKHLLQTKPQMKKNVAKALGGTNTGTGKWKVVKRKVLEWVEHKKTRKVTKTHSKSYPITDVCTDGKGTNFLKCDVLANDPRPICKAPLRAKQIDEKTKCKKKGGFVPMK